MVTISAQQKRFNYKRFNYRGIYGREIDVFSVSLTAGANYYYGDVERNKETFSEKIEDRVRYSAKATFGYSPARYINLKLAVAGGALSGKSENYKFSSFFVEPDIYLQVHPLTVFAKNDIFFYTGIGMNMSKIVSEDLVGHQLNTSSRVPIVPVGFGYQYNFDNGLHVGFELVWRVALIDEVDKNLDAYPYIMENEVIRGTGSKYFDGYYTFGIKFGYAWL